MEKNEDNNNFLGLAWSIFANFGLNFASFGRVKVSV